MANSSRHMARRCVVQALYQWQMTGQTASQIEPNFIANTELRGKHLDYFHSLIDAIPKHIEKIDELIAVHLDRTADKVDLTEQAILRLGAYELNFDQSIPAKVVIDEAIELAKLFCAEHGYKYVNGVLDKIAGEVREGVKDE